MRVGVAILTNGENRIWVQRTIESFLANCSLRPLTIGIFDNGSTDDTYKYISGLPKDLGVEWRVERSNEDLGCGIGVNRAGDLVGEAEYTLFLEKDWTHLRPEQSGVPTTWLGDFLDFMDEEECDYIYLRKFRSEIEMRQHGWARTLGMINLDKGPFSRVTPMDYSNNPHLRRNSAMIESGVLPLPEIRDDEGNPAEHKGKPLWGQAEIRAPKPPNAWIHRWGIFIHEANPDVVMPQFGCGKYGPFGISSCKYGFVQYRGGADPWCLVCEGDDPFNCLAHHDLRYIDYHNELTVEKVESIREAMKKPCVPMDFKPTR